MSWHLLFEVDFCDGLDKLLIYPSFVRLAFTILIFSISLYFDLFDQEAYQPVS